MDQKDAKTACKMIIIPLWFGINKPEMVWKRSSFPARRVRTATAGQEVCDWDVWPFVRCLIPKRFRGNQRVALTSGCLSAGWEIPAPAARCVSSLSAGRFGRKPTVKYKSCCSVFNLHQGNTGSRRWIPQLLMQKLELHHLHSSHV